MWNENVFSDSAKYSTGFPFCKRKNAKKEKNRRIFAAREGAGAADKKIRRQERARRRMLQGEAGADFAAILKDIKARDERDSNRAIAPLKQADDAEYVDTTDMSIDEVVEYICSKCRN